MKKKTRPDMSLINPADSIERQNEKLLQIAQSLMRRVEQKNEQSGFAYQQFERAALLETCLLYTSPSPRD